LNGSIGRWSIPEAPARARPKKPLVAVGQALTLKNSSDEDNKDSERAAAEEDQNVNWDAEINRHAYSDVNSAIHSRQYGR
jgi:hypothetical protein